MSDEKFDITDIFAKAWTLTYRDYNLFFMIVVLSSAFDMLVRWLIPREEKLMYGALSVIGFMISVWGLTALVIAVDHRFRGRTVSLPSALKEAQPLFSTYLITFVVSTLIILGGVVALIIPGLYFAVNFSLATYVAVLERLEWRAALSRSKALIQPYFWPVAGLMLLQSMLPIAAELTLSSVFAGEKAFTSLNEVIARLLTAGLYMPFLVAVGVVLFERLVRLGKQ